MIQKTLYIIWFLFNNTEKERYAHIHHANNTVKTLYDYLKRMQKTDKSNLLILLFLTFIGLILRIQHINHSLWLDEMLHVMAASKSLRDLFHAVSSHSSPPLDYLIVKTAVFILGNSDWAVRMPALIFGIACIPLFYLLSGSVTNRRTALIATTLFVFSPMAIYYSQEARMYSLFLFLSILSYKLTVDVVKNNKFKTSLILGTVNGLLLLTHYFGIFIIITEAIILSLMFFYSKNKKRTAELISVNVMLSFLIFLPWLPLFILTQLSYEASYSMPSNIDFFKSILTSFTTMTQFTGGLKVWIYIYLLAFSTAVVLAYINKEKKLFLTGIIFSLMLCMFFVIAHFRGVVTVRNLIFLLPLFLMVCAYSIDTFLRKFKANHIASACILSLLLLIPAIRDHVSYQKPDWKGAATYIKRHIKPGEKVITTDFLSRGSLAYYLDPDCEYVLMNKNWLETCNNPSWLIWVINDEIMDKIQNHDFSGWTVIPPTTFRLVSNNNIEKYNQLMGESRKKFALGGGHLNVYYFNTN